MVSFLAGAFIFVLSIATGIAFLLDGLFSKKYTFNVTTRKANYMLGKNNLETFDVQKQSHFIILEVGETEGQKHYQELKSDYLNKEDCNVVFVIWKHGIFEFNVGVTYALEAGENLGAMIYKLYKKHGLPLENVHIIGLGVGAHAAGKAGRMVKRMADGQKIRRITGLDPTRCLFEGLLALFDPLTDGDAEIVDVIHTDPGGLGMEDPVGTVDFYPNGGGLQPNCKKFADVSLFDIVGQIRRAGCSHRKSMQYFAASVAGVEFAGRKCDSWKDFKDKLCDENREMVMGDSYIPYSDDAVGKVFLEAILEGDV